VEIVSLKKKLKLDGLVLDAVSGKTLDSTSITITGLPGETPLKLLSDKNGAFSVDLNNYKDAEVIKLRIVFEKNGFVTKELTIEKTKHDMHTNPVISVTERLNKVAPGNGGNEGLFAIEPIYFDLDKSDIRADASEILNKLAMALKAKKDLVIEISSGTDCRATNDYNMKLSQRRAQSTAAYLTAKGVNKKQLKLTWTGETKLANSCACEPTNDSSCSEEQHQQNRRSDFTVISYGVSVPDLKN